MPSTYAHYRMGQSIRRRVGENASRIIEEYPELYLIGLHGPDILFYYHPLRSNKVNRIGYGMHERSGREFFEHARQVIRSHPGEKAYIAYALGFICHFALDVTCHGYIDLKIAESGVPHAEIEVEFDRELMLMDGCDPLRRKLTGHINPSLENAGVIKDFFEGVTAQEVQGALRGMIRNNNLLVAPSRLKREVVYTMLRVSGNYKEMHGLIVNYHKNPACEDSTKVLMELYKKAEKRAIALIYEFRDYLDGKKELGPIYSYTFGTRLPESESMKNELQTDKA